MWRYAMVALCLVAVLAGCSHPLPEYVSKYTPPQPPPPPPAAVAIIGDAYTSGSDVAGYHVDGWPTLVTGQLQQQGIAIDPRVGAQEGSGYLTTGEDGVRSYADQIPAVVAPNTKLIVLFGSANDMGNTSEELHPAVTHTLAAAKAAAPAASLLVIGPAWTDTYPPDELLTVRDVQKSDAQAAGALFVDPITEEWLTDQPDLIGVDGTNLTDAGEAYLAAKIGPLIAQQLQPLPAAALVAPR